MIKDMKRVLSMIFIAALTSFVTFSIAKNYIYNDEPFWSATSAGKENPFHEASLNGPAPGSAGGYVDLEYAAEKSSKAVVHIKTESKARAVSYQNPFGSFFDDFFGSRQFSIPQQQVASGSGVVISPDGFIVTNNHVVEGADEITVTFNNKKAVRAKVIGTDPSTDLAVIKVEEKNLPYLSFGNSDQVKLGEWVLAVGYPLNLETTVTAGIVSAKHRNIGINERKTQSNNVVESFIQTDAAVNPGNSGGALVNAKGDLIGINAAIASPTGSYAGYSYAIPSNLVKKVVDDLTEYGNVQRGYLGIGYMDVKNSTPEQISAYKLDEIDGVYVSMIGKGSGAEKAGLKVGDVITDVGNTKVKTGTELLEKVAQYRPGDKVQINYLRNNSPKTTNVELKNDMGNTDVVKQDVNRTLGARLQNLSSTEARSLRVNGGVKVAELSEGLLKNHTNIKKGFIITNINDEDIQNVEQVNKIFAGTTKTFQISGIYPGYSGIYYYNFRVN